MKSAKVSTVHVQQRAVDSTADPQDNPQPVQIVKPLFMCMTIVGIQNAVRATHDPETVHISRWCSPRCGFYWCIVTAALVWINILRLLPSYSQVDGFDEDTFIRIVIFVWYLQCGINTAVCLRANINQVMLSRLYKLWNKYCKQRSFKKNAKSLRRIVWLLTGGYIMFVLSNIGLIAYIMYSGDPKLVPFTSVLYTPFGEHEALKVFLMLFQAYIAGTWILPLWLFVLICIVNKYILEDTKVAIQEDTDGTSRQYTGDLEVVRMRHEAACDMVECADDMFSLFVALGLATDIPMWCFVLYMMIWPDTQSSYLIIFNTFLLLMNAFHLCTIMWSASKVNTEAHAAFTQLHKMRTAEMSEHNRFQLLLFLSRLQGPPIGMTAWQLFTIDRPSLLTIISIILTYFVILIQLRMPGGMTAGVTGSGNGTGV